MWVVKVTDVLEMRGVPKCHQELQKAKLLYKHDPSFLTIFVSHQWLGSTHPDERGMQFRIFQKSLTNVLSGKIKLELDATSQFFGHQKTLTAEYRNKLKDAYIWMDWFSVPQTEYETDAVERERVRADAGLCIRSIPAYVEACQIFAALVPKLVNPSQNYFSYFTWLSRGWCRAEMWCKLLSDKSDIPIVVMTSKDQVEFAMPMQWLKSPVHEGAFSLEEDRLVVCKFIQDALDFKLARLSQNKDWDIYRYYAGKYEDFVGLPKKRRSMAQFLSYFRFESQEAAIRQKSGMGAMACAALSGDAQLLRTLAEAGAPMNTKLREISQLDVLPDWTPLHLAALRRDADADCVATLLELRADPTAVNRLGHPILGTCETPRAAELLVEYHADVNQMKPLTMATPLTLACLRCVDPEVVGKLLELRADVNLTRGGIGLTPLHSLAIYSHGNPHSLTVASMLIDAKADLDRRVKVGAVFRAVELACRGIMRLQKEPMAIVRVLAEGSTTPMGYAAMFGGDALLDLLIDAGADPEVPNNRGRTPMALSRHMAVHSILSNRTESASTDMERSAGSIGASPRSPGSPRGVYELSSPADATHEEEPYQDDPKAGAADFVTKIPTYGSMKDFLRAVSPDQAVKEAIVPDDLPKLPVLAKKKKTIQSV